MPDIRICPNCQSNLDVRTFGNLTVDACPRCAGIFFDCDEVTEAKAEGFESLEDAVTPTEPKKVGNESRKCPKCRGTMQRYRYQYTSPIQLDCCPTCDGIWVDDGELRQMAEFCRQPTDRSAEAQAVAKAAASQMEQQTIANLDRAYKIRRLFGILSTPLRGY